MRFSVDLYVSLSVVSANLIDRDGLHRIFGVSIGTAMCGKFCQSGQWTQCYNECQNSSRSELDQDIPNAALHIYAMMRIELQSESCQNWAGNYGGIHGGISQRNFNPSCP